METLVSGVLDHLFATVQSLQSQSRVLAWVTISVAVLVLLSVLFSIYVTWLRVRNHLRARRWADREDRWTDLTLEAVVGERTVEELATKVGSSERLSFLAFLLRYARRLTGRERQRVRELSVPFLPALEPLLRDRDVYRRARAVQTLGTLGLPEHSEALVSAVNDESPIVSMLAARALAAYGGATYAEPIVANLDRFEHWGSEYVTSLLVSLGPAAAPELRGVMEDESRFARTRALAADALRNLNDLDAIEPASEILRRALDPDLAAALLRLVSVLGGTDQLEIVRNLLQDPHFAVRAEAYSAVGALADKEDDGVLEEGLTDASPWVALHAARGIRERGGEVRLLQLSESDHPGARAAAQVLAED